MGDKYIRNVIFLVALIAISLVAVIASALMD